MQREDLLIYTKLNKLAEKNKKKHKLEIELYEECEKLNKANTELMHQLEEEKGKEDNTMKQMKEMEEKMNNMSEKNESSEKNENEKYKDESSKDESSKYESSKDESLDDEAEGAILLEAAEHGHINSFSSFTAVTSIGIQTDDEEVKAFETLGRAKYLMAAAAQTFAEAKKAQKSIDDYCNSLPIMNDQSTQVYKVDEKEIEFPTDLNDGILNEDPEEDDYSNREIYCHVDGNEDGKSRSHHSTSNNEERDNEGEFPCGPPEFVAAALRRAFAKSIDDPAMWGAMWSKRGSGWSFK